MATWNYRMTVMLLDGDEFWAVRELYYDEAGEVTAWSESPVTATGQSWRECLADLSRIVAATGLARAYDLDARRWCGMDREPIPEVQ